MKPLLDETRDGLERTLLEEARDYKASPKARAAALGIVVTPRPWLKGLGLKLSLGAIAALAIGGALWVRTPAPIAAPVETTPVTTPETTVTAHATITTTAPPPIATAPENMPSVTSALTARTTGQNAIQQPAPKSTLSEEIALIDRARTAVYSKDREAAIRALDEYDRRFPQGSLAPEAKTLRARASAL